MTEPLSGEEGLRERSPRARVALLAVALAFGGLLASFAPGDWPEGRGSVEVELRGERLIATPVDVGATDPFALEGERATTSVEVVFPDGLRTDGEITARITVLERGEVRRLELGDVRVRIGLPDGRDELVPVVRWDEATRELEAQRRPSQDAAVVLGLLGVVVVLWVTEAFPLFVTSLLVPIVLVFTGVSGASDATSPFFNPIVVLFFAGFLMAEAMQRCGLDHRVAVTITERAGRSAPTLFATMIALAAFLSMWMSNTAATVVLIPIALAVSDPLGEPPFQRALVLGIAYASTIGGVGSAIGTPTNQLAIEFLEEYGERSISFVEWFGYGVPMVVLFLPMMGLFLWRRQRMRFDPEKLRRAREVAQEERAALGRPGRHELTVLAVFGAVAFGWLTESFHDVHAGIVALAGAVALFAVGRLRPDDLARIAWPALLTFGGGLTLGLFLVETGTSGYLATRLTGLAGWPTPLAVLAVALVALVLTTVASNTASAAVLVPLAVPLAGVIGIEPTTLVIVVAIASSIDFALVIGTPPTMIAYATHLYTAGQIFRAGVLLDLLGIALLVAVVIRIWEATGLV